MFDSALLNNHLEVPKMRKLQVAAGLVLVLFLSTSCASGRLCTPAQGAVVGGLVGAGGFVADGTVGMITMPAGAALGAGFCHFVGGSKTVDFYRENHRFSKELEIEGICRQRYTEEVNLKLYSVPDARRRFYDCLDRTRADRRAESLDEGGPEEPSSLPWNDGR